MKLRSSWPAVASTIRSILGRGKLSFGHALFISVKSIQSRHLPFVFLTSTTLANHSGYSTSLIPLALFSYKTWSSLVIHVIGLWMECIGFLTSARGQDALLGLPLFLWAQGTGLRSTPIFKPYQTTS